MCAFCLRLKKGGGGGRFWSRSDPVSDPIGYLQSPAFVRVWHRARKDRQNCRSIPIGAGRAVYVMPAKRVARLGAAICAAGLTRIFDCSAVKIPLPRFLTILFLQ